MSGLTTSQRFEIEQHLFKGRNAAAVKAYQASAGVTASEAEAAVDGIAAELYARKPWMFPEPPGSSRRKTATPRLRGFMLLFLVVDTVLFAGAVWWFFLRDTGTPTVNMPTAASTVAPAVRQSPPPVVTRRAEVAVPGPRAEALTLPSVDRRSFTADLDEDASFVSLYRQRLEDPDYAARKSDSSRSRRIDASVVEARIKTARAHLAAVRRPPPGESLIQVPRVAARPALDGLLAQAEWQDAIALRTDAARSTRLFLQSDGEWLFVACDAPGETTPGGYDQLRVYLHAGLLPELVNERVHLGRGAGVTTIRQTTLKWRGVPPANDDERWKRHPVSDWGIYRYARGISALHGHRQYEMALHLGEAGLQPGVPFTLFAEIETDPLRDAERRFVERRYLGRFGDQERPLWLVID
jgi:hypothetical protein